MREGFEMTQDMTPEEIGRAIADQFLSGPATEQDAAREAIAAEEAEPPKPSRDEQIDAFRRAREAAAQADREAFKAGVEADKAAWRSLGITDDDALARFLALPRAERDRMLAEGMDAPSYTDWRVAAARLMPNQYGAALAAIDKAREIPDLPDLADMWFDHGRADLVARMIPGARPASEVPLSPEEAYEAAKFRAANPDLFPEPEQTAPQPRPTTQPRDEGGRFTLTPGQRARIRAALPPAPGSRR